MLPSLLNTPKSPQDWEQFSFANRDILTQIRQAIQSQTGVNLTEYQVYPINFDAIKGFLEANQQSHSDFNAVLGAQSSDLQDVDVKDQKQLQVWINLNYLELQSACQILGI